MTNEKSLFFSLLSFDWKTDKVGRTEMDQTYYDLVLPYVQSRPLIFFGSPSNSNPNENGSEENSREEIIKEFYSLEMYHRMGSAILSRSFHVEKPEDDDDDDDAEETQDQEQGNDTLENQEEEEGESKEEDVGEEEVIEQEIEAEESDDEEDSDREVSFFHRLCSRFLLSKCTSTLRS